MSPDHAACPTHLILFVLQLVVDWGGHVMSPCHHHGMMCPWVTDGEDSLQIWRVTASILNRQSYSWQWVVLQLGVWVRVYLLIGKKMFIMKCYRRTWNWADASGSDGGPVAGSCEHGNEPSGSIKGGDVVS